MPACQDDEKELISTWVDERLPAGRCARTCPQLRAVRSRLADSAAGRGLSGCREPFSVPAKGVVEYQYFTIDPGLKEDKWIKAAEARPGNRAVTHHLIVFFHPPGKRQVRADRAAVQLDRRLCAGPAAGDLSARASIAGFPPARS